MAAALVVVLSGCGRLAPAPELDANGYAYGTSSYDSGLPDETGYETGYESGYGSDLGGYDDGGLPSASPSPSPSPLAMVPEGPRGLTARVIEARETNPLGLGSVVARVEAANPTDRELTGVLRVMFTDDGDPTANLQTRRVTLAPRSARYFSFSAKGWRLDGAEATIETEFPAEDGSGNVVRERS